jgi:hypothetical protein
MLRKSTMLRFLGLLLVVGASFGALNATAPSAEAQWCAHTFLGCEFRDVEVIGEYSCCVYQCPNGSQKLGFCEHLIPLPLWP